MTLQDEQQIYLVSDGGEENGLGYYGWVIVTENQILVKHKGHAADNPRLIESLRTKSVGALTIICCYVVAVVDCFVL